MPLPADAPAGLCPQCLLKSNPATPPHTIVVTGAPPSTHRPVPVPGQDFGEYRILRLLGQGGMGEVYECEHIASGRRVALKVMSHALAGEQDRKRFLREGRLAASVNHPNVVYVHGSEEIDGMPVIAMELARGGTLHDRLKRQGPLPLAEAIQAVLQMIDGLEAAHAAGVLHRDIKPANCFVTPEGIVKIGDFGLSVSTLARGESLLTAAGSVMGTPAYASPEQLRGGELDVRSDIYSVGATLYHLLTGKTPYTATEFVKLITEVLEKEPAAPNAVRKEIPPELSRLVMRCLAKNRKARFQSYEELREALLPFRAADVLPANPARRVIAGIIDDLFAYGPGFLFLAYWSFDPLDYFVRERTATAAIVWIAFYGWYLLYYAIAEGLWGSAFGKTICGLRVVGRGGQVPGIPRALLRVAIYVSPMVLPSLVYLALVSQNEMRAVLARGDTLITDWIWWSYLLLFVTMRRRNGYAAIHDLLSGTRVIVRPRTQRRLPFVFAEREGERPREPLFIGPYEIRSSLWKTADEELLLAFDPALRRNIWIHLRPLTAEPLDPVRRDLSRPARLRWLNGGQTDSHRWEAYEAPTGGVLSKAHWSSVRFWLLDLAEELRAGIEEPATAAPLGLDRVWITGAGRAMLLDFPTTTSDVLDIATMQSFLAQVADAALDPAYPASLDGKAFIAALKRQTFDRAEFVIGNLSVLVSKPAEVVPAWRAMSLLFLPACFALLGILGAGMFNFESIRWERSWKSLYPDRPSFLHAAQIYLGLAEEGDETNDVQLARAYLVTHFSDVITNQAFWSNPDLAASFGQPERELLQQALTPTPAPNVVQEAEGVVPGWIQKQERQARRIPIGVFVGVLLFGLVCIGLIEFIAALLFRRSFVLNLFGIAAVDRRGDLATRLRLLGRWAIGSLPALLIFFAGFVILAGDGTLPFLAAARSAFGISVTFLVAAAVAYAIRHPSRSLADRLARTFVVPK
jgi:hypothetical protein